MSKHQILQLFFILSLLVTQGCTDSESAARKLYNEGMTFQQQGENDKAIEVYKEIVSSYPETETAVEVNKILMSLKALGDINKNIQTKINETELKAKQVQKEDLRAALDLFKLDNGRYPSTEEGLEALVTKPYGYSHWNGPYISNLTAESIDEFVYENNGGFSNIVLSIKTN
ncbi:type II secretion system protein GspG [Desulfuromonas thiophila]|uniref:type II secretion system protein GspG n=1 Tax=Desulfuromonas thiophila TaxID=57664 RepID=UPI000B213FE7|nr:type II secretion system protein GspG [Desulfuromonas thiophila]